MFVSFYRVALIITGSFAFLIAGSMYLVTLGVAHMLMPKMTPLDENLKRIEA